MANSKLRLNLFLVLNLFFIPFILLAQQESPTDMMVGKKRMTTTPNCDEVKQKIASTAAKNNEAGEQAADMVWYIAHKPATCTADDIYASIKKQFSIRRAEWNKNLKNSMLAAFNSSNVDTILSTLCGETNNLYCSNKTKGFCHTSAAPSTVSGCNNPAIQALASPTSVRATCGNGNINDPKDPTKCVCDESSGFAEDTKTATPAAASTQKTNMNIAGFANPTSADGSWTTTGSSAATTNPNKVCVCDSNKFFAPAVQGLCVRCINDNYEYNEASKSCVAKAKPQPKTPSKICKALIEANPHPKFKDLDKEVDPAMILLSDSLCTLGNDEAKSKYDDIHNKNTAVRFIAAVINDAMIAIAKKDRDGDYTIPEDCLFDKLIVSGVGNTSSLSNRAIQSCLRTDLHAKRYNIPLNIAQFDMEQMLGLAYIIKYNNAVEAGGAFKNMDQNVKFMIELDADSEKEFCPTNESAQGWFDILDEDRTAQFLKDSRNYACLGHRFVEFIKHGAFDRPNSVRSED